MIQHAGSAEEEEAGSLELAGLLSALDASEMLESESAEDVSLDTEELDSEETDDSEEPDDVWHCSSHFSSDSKSCPSAFLQACLGTLMPHVIRLSL
ncbi:MAG: hypothetical protein PHO92_03050 [Candidatus Peribacteraceae bacterium]|nr:hypothetical protein [Candidatus Peribacteraceae bacterium]